MILGNTIFFIYLKLDYLKKKKVRITSSNNNFLYKNKINCAM